MSKSTVSAIAATLLAVACVAATQRQLAVRVTAPPYDDACEISDLCETRKRLLALIEARNAKAVLAMMSPQFNEPLVETRREFVRLISEHSSGIWPELQKILTVGGMIRRGGDQLSFCAPHVFVSMPAGEALLDEADSDGHLAVVVVASTPFLASGSASAQVLGRVGYEVVAQSDDAPPWEILGERGGFMRVFWNGRWGYIAREHLWSEQDPHVCLARQGGEWRLSEFLAANGL